MVDHIRIIPTGDSATLARAIGRTSTRLTGMQTKHAGTTFIPDGSTDETGAPSGGGVLIGPGAKDQGGIARQDPDGTLKPVVDVGPIKSQLEQVNRTLDDNKQALDQANTDLADARKSADSALAQATDALARASAARTAADSASTAASSASSKADEAQKAADNAASAASSASSKADSAQRSADSASNAASAAASTASDASQRAASALANANRALARATHVTMAPDAPSSPTTGDVWFPTDTTGRATGMEQYDGAHWVDVQLVAGSVLVPGSVGSTLIADGAVTTPKLEAGSVDADRLAANAVTADKLAANSVTADKLAANSVTADKIAAEAITGDKIAANSISASKLTISAGNLFSNPTFAGDGQYGTTDRVDNVTLPDGSTGSTAAMRMDVTGMNPYVADSEWISCNRGDVFYVGVWLSYADDTRSVPQGGTLNFGLNTRGDSSESWPNNGAQGLNIDMSEIPFNSGTGDKWKYFHTYVACPATGVTRFWINAHGNSNGFHLLVWRPTVIRAADAKLIVNGSITADKIAAGSIDADKIKGNKLIGTQIQTGDKPPYMLLCNQHTQATSDLSVETDQGQLSLVGEDESDLGGISFMRMDSVTGPNARDDYMLSIAVVDPGRADDSEHGNEIRLVDADTSGMGSAGSTAADDRSISLISHQTSVSANSGGTHRDYEFTPEGLYAPDVGGYYMACSDLYDRDDNSVQGGPQDVYLDNSVHIDDYQALDIQFVTNAEMVHGSQRFYKPPTGTWVGFKFALSLNYYGHGNQIYADSTLMQFLSGTHINTIKSGSDWLSGQSKLSDRAATLGNFLWITHISGMRR